MAGTIGYVLTGIGFSADTSKHVQQTYTDVEAIDDLFCEFIGDKPGLLTELELLEDTTVFTPTETRCVMILSEWFYDNIRDEHFDWKMFSCTSFINFK